jgi:cytochrome P450
MSDLMVDARSGTVGAIDFNPLFPPQSDDPFPSLAELRKERPIFLSPSLNMWVVTRYQDAQAIVKDPQTFSSKQMFGPQISEEAKRILEPTLFGSASGGLILSDPPEHTRLRQVLSAAFSARQVAQMEPRIRELVKGLIQAFPPQDPIDIVEAFSRPLPTFAIGRLLGVPPEDYHRLRLWAADAFRLISQPLPPEEQVKLAQSVLNQHEYMTRLVEERRQKPQDDLTSALLEVVAQEDAKLSTRELVELLTVVFAAGFESTMHLLTASLNFLLKDRSQWEALSKNPEFIPGVVEECLRLFPPIIATIRTTTREVELGGVVLPAYAPVYVVLASANRDEREFPEPETCRHHRENSNRHLAFGHGIHFCMGAPLARLEVRIALEMLSEQLPNLCLAPDQKALTATPGLLVRGYEHLFVARG